MKKNKTANISKQSKDDLKENISNNINAGNIKEAKEMIRKYEELYKIDAELYSMKSIVMYIEDNLDGALGLANMGLSHYPENFDLLYNLAYLYKAKGENNLAVEFYKKAYNTASDKGIKSEIQSQIDEINKNNVASIKENNKISVLIGSPVHQKPEILEQFLLSLKRLNKDGIEIHYLFIDDNEIEYSSKLLNEFSQKEKNVVIYKGENPASYVCNEDTHQWKENLVWKVAGFKDMIINIAIEYGYDYLFLIDSDLVLHPKTLQKLIEVKKDIVSNIFWTSWHEGEIKLPQVWLKDVYTQYQIERGEQLSQDEVIRRFHSFLNQLRQPGTYEVGGLGACTLISKYALEKGVCFKEIKNLSFWGEDRHFCIRAGALGIPLFVDTHYPAYHIYRMSDLAGVEKYNRDNGVNSENIKKLAVV